MRGETNRTATNPKKANHQYHQSENSPCRLSNLKFPIQNRLPNSPSDNPQASPPSTNPKGIAASNPRLRGTSYLGSPIPKSPLPQGGVAISSHLAHRLLLSAQLSIRTDLPPPPPRIGSNLALLGRVEDKNPKDLAAD
jgi:hypothetical protein